MGKEWKQEVMIYLKELLVFTFGTGENKEKSK